MKITQSLKNNGIEIDADVYSLTNDELITIVKNIPKHNLILIKNVDHDKNKLTDFFDRIGKTYIRPEGLYFTDDDKVQITRVTNKRDDDGKKIGLFADLELGWHCNGTLRKDVKQTTLGLYCVTPGDQDFGITGFTNMHKAYMDMPHDIKELCDHIMIDVSFHAFTGEQESLYKGDEGYKLQSDDPEYEIFSGKNVHKTHVYTSVTDGLKKPLVVTHPWSGQKSLYFIPSVITGWESTIGQTFDGEKLWNYLMDHCYSGNYSYYHRWESGDLILNDQWTGMHNRSEVKGERLLYRYCVDNTIITG